MNTVSLPISRHTFSHNLLTPLTAILGNIWLFKDELNQETLTFEQTTYLLGRLRAIWSDVSVSGEELLKFVHCLIEQARQADLANCHCEQQEKRWLSVLLVENTSLAQTECSQILEGFNCHVDIASNGYEALEMLTKNYDAILLDLQMPGMNGYETASKIRQLFKYVTPIIGITSSPLEDVQDKCKQAGFNKVIPKPLDVDTIKNSLKELTGKQNI